MPSLTTLEYGPTRHRAQCTASFKPETYLAHRNVKAAVCCSVPITRITNWCLSSAAHGPTEASTSYAPCPPCNQQDSGDSIPAATVPIGRDKSTACSRRGRFSLQACRGMLEVLLRMAWRLRWGFSFRHSWLAGWWFICSCRGPFPARDATSGCKHPSSAATAYSS